MKLVLIEGRSLSIINELIIILFHLQMMPFFYFTCSILSTISQKVISVTVSNTRQSNACSIMITVII